MTAALPVLTAEDVVASAVATPSRLVDLELNPSALPGLGALERLRTLAAAIRAGVHERELWDARCGRRFELGAFVRHCREVDHHLGDVVLDDAVPDERWLGRQGESRTAVSQW